MPELRAEVDKPTLDVMDGYCSSNGMCRTKLTNQILGAWAKQKHHESTIILRVAGDNPTFQDKKN